MAFLKELIFVVIFLIHTNAAISLNFFNFIKGTRANETIKEIISIEPTKTVSASIRITDSPIQTINQSLPEPNIRPIDIEKHEFENETEAIDASPENTADFKPSTLKPTWQEIDETKNSSYLVKETINEEHSKEESAKPTSTSNRPDIPKVSLLKLLSLPKKKTVTFTNTIVSKFTKYKTVYPSCVKMEKVKSVCDGKLITIEPTPTVLNAANERTETSNITNDEVFDIIEPPEVRKKRSSDSKITMKNLKESDKLGPNAFVIEPSELDYEFEEFNPVPANRYGSEKLHGRGTQPISIIESLAAEPKFEFVTKYLPITSVQTVTNNDFTATIIAHNCVPRNINLKKCQIMPESVTTTRHPILPVKSIINKQNISKSETEQVVKKNEQKTFASKPSSSLSSEHETRKPFDSINELNKYLSMNAHRLIHSNVEGYEIIDLNAESIIIEASDDQPPFYNEKRSTRVKRER